MKVIDKKLLAALLVFHGLFFGRSAVDGAQSLRTFLFNSQDVLKKGWEEKIHTKPMKVAIASMDGSSAMELDSADAASGYFFKFEKPWDPNQYPISSFTWRVDALPGKEAPSGAIEKNEGSVQVAARRGGLGGRREEEGEEGLELSRKEQDDYFRIYFITDAFSIAFAKCLEYVWDVHRGVMTRLRSPWSDSIRLLVLENKSSFGQWRKEERNVLEDFKLLFGRTTWDKNIAAIAFMLDTDNSQGKAKAFLREMKIGMPAEAGIGEGKPLYHFVWQP
ncbi:MAG: DUF3047 domain-containing protein [Deltaproteobacteria bacterium]|nr:DUF3047 domain-containing protein [Deltaproteobacteria bacterium]